MDIVLQIQQRWWHPSPPSPHFSSFLYRSGILFCDRPCRRHPLLLLPSFFVSSPLFSSSLLCDIERGSLSLIWCQLLPLSKLAARSLISSLLVNNKNAATSLRIKPFPI
ncbi:hypothetical protein AAHE18_07G070900 [Arachis hypogaea]